MRVDSWEGGKGREGRLEKREEGRGSSKKGREGRGGEGRGGENRTKAGSTPGATDKTRTQSTQDAAEGNSTNLLPLVQSNKLKLQTHNSVNIHVNAKVNQRSREHGR